MENDEIIRRKLAEFNLCKLVASGYLILSYSGVYCNAVKNIGGVDRYVLLEWKNDTWVILSQ